MESFIAFFTALLLTVASSRSLTYWIYQSDKKEASHYRIEFPSGLSINGYVNVNFNGLIMVRDAIILTDKNRRSFEGAFSLKKYSLALGMPENFSIEDFVVGKTFLTFDTGGNIELRDSRFTEVISLELN
jgi:hypothetical protein